MFELQVHVLINICMHYKVKFYILFVSRTTDMICKETKMMRSEFFFQLAIILHCHHEFKEKQQTLIYFYCSSC